MSINGELGMGPGEYGSRLARGSMDREDFLKCRQFKQLGACHEYLMDQKIDSFAVFNDVFVEPRVA